MPVSFVVVEKMLEVRVIDEVLVGPVGTAQLGEHDVGLVGVGEVVVGPHPRGAVLGDGLVDGPARRLEVGDAQLLVEVAHPGQGGGVEADGLGDGAAAVGSDGHGGVDLHLAGGGHHDHHDGERGQAQQA